MKAHYINFISQFGSTDFDLVLTEDDGIFISRTSKSIDTKVLDSDFLLGVAKEELEKGTARKETPSEVKIDLPKDITLEDVKIEAARIDEEKKAEENKIEEVLAAGEKI